MAPKHYNVESMELILAI